MGRRFLLAFLTLSALLLMLHARADGSATTSQPVQPNLRSRALRQNPELEKSISDPPAEKEPPPPPPPSLARKADDDESETEAEAPTESESRKLGRHRSPDKSVAGGGVIIGGLVTAIFAAVCCYIRVTRRRPAESLT